MTKYNFLSPLQDVAVRLNDFLRSSISYIPDNDINIMLNSNEIQVHIDVSSLIAERSDDEKVIARINANTKLAVLGLAQHFLTDTSYALYQQNIFVYYTPDSVNKIIKSKIGDACPLGNCLCKKYEQNNTTQT